jgi:cytochrome c peroxidase
VSDPVKQGHELLFGKAKCRQCHAGNNFTDRKNKNPYLDVKMEPLRLSPAEVDAIVAFLESLEGEGYQDKAPAAFPQ